jgi:hypothetical protein
MTGLLLQLTTKEGKKEGKKEKEKETTRRFIIYTYHVKLTRDASIMLSPVLGLYRKTFSPAD